MKSNLRKKYYECQLKRIYYRVFLKTQKTRKSNYFAKKNVIDIDSANEYIYKSIMSNRPFVLARFGAFELATVFCGISDKYKFTHNSIKRSVKKGCLHNNAGVFPNTEEIHKKFCELMINSVKELDVLAIWRFIKEEFIVENFADENTKLIELRAMEPWYSEKNCWTKALEGKKVLVIHPFAETIEKQYKKRELIFPKTQYLPEFELHTLKAVQTIAGVKDERFGDWFEALDWMYNEALKIDFDVAIIGCGAYGFPLAAMLKKAGKQAIHMAGATQILFGIKGKRWDNHPVISKLYNEHWVRPETSDIPKDAKKVEGGCYW